MTPLKAALESIAYRLDKSEKIRDSKADTPHFVKYVTGLRDEIGELTIGVIASLGVRGEAESVAPLGALLNDDDASVARAAAIALGAIRSAEAAKALAAGKPTAETKSVISDSLLACAEEFLDDGKKIEALAIYKRLLIGEPPKHVKLAATRGMLACAGK